ncbi:MAG TPA: CHASE3 domain-containing protein [Puia sp.]|nr:CHASE3 domain-containing protein [Puia sp.]
MVFNFTGKIRAGYLTAFILLLFSYSITFYTTWQLSNRNKILNHTSEVMDKLEMLNSDIKDATIGVRGYIIMKDTKYLLPYYNSRKNVDSFYKLLINLTSDNTLQQQRLPLLGDLIRRKFALAEEEIKAFNEEGISSGLIENITIASKKNSDSLRNIIGVMQNREHELQKLRREDVISASATIKIINLSSLVVSILLVIYSVITFNIENKAKREADNRAAIYSQQLEERVKELNKLNIELKELKNIEKLAITGRIARAIAHEVRNPLTNISLATDQLQSQIPEDPENVTLLEMINRNVHRINQLVTDLLNSSKFSELNYENAPVNKILDEALELAMDRIMLKKITVQTDYAKNLCNVSVDVEKIKIAFLNIIVNGIEAMADEKGILKITTEDKNKRCVITISDNGTGMDKETISKLFEPYFTNKSKGNGLGLTHTQNIILNHRASIEVKSELGKGSSFIISLNFATK